MWVFNVQYYTQAIMSIINPVLNNNTVTIGCQCWNSSQEHPTIAYAMNTEELGKVKHCKIVCKC